LELAACTTQVARAHGGAVQSLELGNVLTLSLGTAASVQVVGVTIVVAALALPASAAALLTRTLGGALIAAGITAVHTGVLGVSMFIG
jgi:ABC-type Mn2+/Zn2+ transport system permease subunit